MSQCKIQLENYSGFYVAGGEIRGRLECFFDEDTKVRAIKIRLKCNEHNEWSGSEEYLDTTDQKYKTRSVQFTGDNDILSIEQLLCGTGTDSQTLPQGRRVYPFTFSLPTDIPSSFKGPYGQISYCLKGIVDRPMRSDYEDKFSLIIKSPIDFNSMPHVLQEEIFYSEEKNVCCLCCKGGLITMDVKLPKLAYTTGETIYLTVIVKNLSREVVEKLLVRLAKIIEYKVQSPSFENKRDSEEIATVSDHGLGPHGEHTYNLSIPLPTEWDIPNFATCRLFEVSYKLEVTCKLPKCIKNLDVFIFPIIGNIKWTDSSSTAPIVSPQLPYNMGFVVGPDNIIPSAPPAAVGEGDLAGGGNYLPPVHPKEIEAATNSEGGNSSTSQMDDLPPSYDQLQNELKNMQK